MIQNDKTIALGITGLLIIAILVFGVLRPVSANIVAPTFLYGAPACLQAVSNGAIVSPNTCGITLGAAVLNPLVNIVEIATGSVGTSGALSTFHTEWTVPNSPTVNTQQVISFYSYVAYIQSSTSTQVKFQLFASVLQYSSGNIPGPWYIFSYAGLFICGVSGSNLVNCQIGGDYSPPYAVNVGDAISSDISISGTGTSPSITDSTIGKTSILAVSVIPPNPFVYAPTAFGAVLEATNINSCSSYPNAASTTFSNILENSNLQTLGSGPPIKSYGCGEIVRATLGQATLFY